MNLHKKIPNGTVFGRLTVESYAGVFNKIHKYNCICICGKKTLNNATDLRSGDTKSCGCLKLEVVSRTHSTHRDTGSCTHQTWKTMIQRCTNSKNHKYPRYGAKGITVCDRWKNSYGNFLKDMGLRPEVMHKNGKTREYTLDRIDSKGNYEPSNCRWATKIEQARQNKWPVRESNISK